MMVSCLFPEKKSPNAFSRTFHPRGEANPTGADFRVMMMATNEHGENGKIKHGYSGDRLKNMSSSRENIVPLNAD